MSWAGFAAGIAILLLTASSVLGTLIVPRASAPRLTVLITRSVHRAFLLVTDRVDDYRARDRIEALNGPALLISLLGAWVALVFLSFALLFWPFVSSFGSALQVTGSSMFTLGFILPRGPAPVALAFLCAMSGLVIVALQIAYLPTLYAAFNRRETLVTMLEFLGGVPAWGPEVLIRHELIDNTERLGWLYERWTEWAADVSESHTTYPQLLYFRSPKALRSWVVGAAGGDGRGGAPPQPLADHGAGIGPPAAAHGLRGPPRAGRDPGDRGRPRPRPRRPDPAHPGRVRRRGRNGSCRSAGSSSETRTRPGSTSTDGGSTTRPPPTGSPSASTPRPPSGRGRAAGDATR